MFMKNALHIPQKFVVIYQILEIVQEKIPKFSKICQFWLIFLLKFSTFCKKKTCQIWKKMSKFCIFLNFSEHFDKLKKKTMSTFMKNWSNWVENLVTFYKKSLNFAFRRILEIVWKKLQDLFVEFSKLGKFFIGVFKILQKNVQF